VVTRRLAAVGGDGSSDELVQYFAMCGVWALSTYTACDIRCSYCITYAQGVSKPRVPKADVGVRLRDELARVPPDGTIGVGAFIDAYPSVEERERVTRAALEELVHHRFRTVIVTKGTAIVRDIDLLEQLRDLAVNVSLCSLDDDALQAIEPQAPPSGARLAAITALARAGIDVQLHVQPFVPGVTDAERLIEAVDPSIRVWFAPLQVRSPAVARTALGRRFTQADLDDAYLREAERVGRRPNVVWQRPLWLTDPLSEGVRATSHAGSRAARNCDTIRRLVDALNRGTQLTMLFDLWSPYVRGHDARGVSIRHSHPDSGFFRDALFEAAGAFDGARFDLTDLQAIDDDTVRAHVSVNGVHTRPLLGAAPTGRRVTMSTEHTFRFDDQGLVVEFIQDVDLAAVLAAGPPPARQMA
jgi:DNA repair photolyase/predicted ester cyclase